MDVKSLISLGTGYWKNPKVKQVVMLFSVNIISIPIGVVTSIVLTHYLGPSAFGDYQFLDNFFTLTVLICTFGFFQAANRALVLNSDKEKAREYYGATLVVLIGLFFFMSLALVLYSLFDPNLKAKHLDKILLFTIPFSWVYLVSNYFEVLFQADNRINLLAISRLLPKFGYLIGAVVIYYFAKNDIDKLGFSWALYIFILVIVCMYVLYKLKLSFKNLRETIKEIWHYNKTYGFHVYTGAAFAVGVSQLTGIIVSYYGTNNSGVGYFTLALVFASPLQFIPNTIATTNYKEFASHARIPKKLTQLTVLLTILSLCALWVIVPIFINTFYGEKFHQVIYLNFIVSIGVALYGMGDYYNRFLGAHGHGKLLRNTAFIVGFLILVLNFILIPTMGAKGAAITRLSGGVSYLLCILYYYRKTVNKAAQ